MRRLSGPDIDAPPSVPERPQRRARRHQSATDGLVAFGPHSYWHKVHEEELYTAARIGLVELPLSGTTPQPIIITRSPARSCLRRIMRPRKCRVHECA